MANQACFMESIDVSHVTKMCPIQSLVSLLRLLADVVIPEPLNVHMTSYVSFYSLVITIRLLPPSFLSCNSLLYQLSACMFSHLCNPQRRDREVGWPIPMKYSICLPLLHVLTAPQEARICPVLGAVSDWTGAGGKRGSNSPHSASLTPNTINTNVE